MIQVNKMIKMNKRIKNKIIMKKYQIKLIIQNQMRKNKTKRHKNKKINK